MAGRHSDCFYENSWWSCDKICREWKREQVEWLLFFLPEVLRGYWEVLDEPHGSVYNISIRYRVSKRSLNEIWLRGSKQRRYLHWRKYVSF